MLSKEFTPKLFDTLKNYKKEQFFKDLQAGLIVGIVALPLAIAFGIASGVTPEKGLITAVIAGFLISVLGGSRVQIGGPTGAFIVIVYGIVQSKGVDALIVATFIAGIMLLLMGFAKLGNIIKFIPYPLIVGFTTGIALIIFSSQIKDFLGLQMGAVPADFSEKWIAYFQNILTVNWYAVVLAVGTVLVSVYSTRISRKIPGSLIAILLTTVIVYWFKLPVETIGSKFGNIASSIPTPVVPHIDWDTFKSLIAPAFAIALLGGIESLLSAVVADGMIGGNHRSNMELVAQGAANMASSIFGGIPATGAIARTATNVKNGGRTPVAGIVHALVLLIIMIFVAKWASLIPMATLAGILVVVAYNMSEWKNFLAIARGNRRERGMPAIKLSNLKSVTNLLRDGRTDVIVLLTTFLLTVFIDLTVAIEIGMVLAAFLFIRDIGDNSSVDSIKNQFSNAGQDEADDELAVSRFEIPKGVEVYEINGPLFFGAAYKFRDSIREIEKKPKVLILRMRKVPYMDATGLRTLKDVLGDMQRQGVKVILSGVSSEKILEDLNHSRVTFMVGKANIKPVFPEALEHAKEYLNSLKS